MTYSASTLLSLPIITSGTESGLWGNITNNGLTEYLDISIAGSLSLTTDADVDLAKTAGTSSATNIGSTTAQYMVLNCTGSRTATRNINAPKQSKLYVVINATTGSQDVVLRGGPTSPTTGVTIANGATVLCAWNGSDFIFVSSFNIFTAAQTFRAANAIRSEAASTQDAVVIAGRAGGSSSYAVTLTPATLSANRTLTLPEPGSDETLGYLNIPQNSKSVDYTLVLTDAGKHILHPSADTSARTFTIPANSSVAFPIGTAITFINQNGAGVITIAITTDTMRLSPAGTTGSRTLAANGIATCIKLTSTEWIISGSGLT